MGLNNSVESRVIEALAEVRTFVQQDGGDIEFVKLEDNKVYIKLTGACKSCPLSFFTLSMGIEDKVRQRVPEITEVVAVED